MRNLLAVLMAVAMAASLSACARRPIPDEPAPLVLGNFTEGYLLEPGNRVRVIVFNENNLSGDFQLDNGGNLALPLVGMVPASGINAKLLARRLEEALTHANYMRDPKVAVEIVTYRPFYVLGEVKQPGEYPYTTGTTVLSAVARAGGYEYRALEDKVILVRMVDGTQREYNAIERTPIMPGDIVRVVQRWY